MPVIEQPSLTTDAVAIWAKLVFPKESPVFICSFYRPPNTNTIPIVLLHETLRILQQSSSSPNIIIGGDFNLPSVIWSDAGASIAPSPDYGREINDLFLDLINDVSLEQLVFQPTRQRNILDLVLSSHPDTISNVEVVPGMSDHEIIVFDINLYASTPCTKATYSVYLYHRGNLNGIRQDMLNFKDVFMSSTPHHNSVEVNWTSLKEALLKSVSKHIPMKKYKNSHRNLPWINRSIKSHMKNEESCIIQPSSLIQKKLVLTIENHGTKSTTCLKQLMKSIVPEFWIHHSQAINANFGNIYEL